MLSHCGHMISVCLGIAINELVFKTEIVAEIITWLTVDKEYKRDMD